MKVYVDNKDKMTAYQWGHDEESKRYFVKLNFDLPSDTKVKVLSLADYTKQVRKEVVQEIKEIIESDAVKYLDFNRDEFALDYQEFKDILNEIEQGE